MVTGEKIQIADEITQRMKNDWIPVTVNTGKTSARPDYLTDDFYISVKQEISNPDRTKIQERNDALDKKHREAGLSEFLESVW